MKKLVPAFLLLIGSINVGAQDNYEIQVYDAETTPKYNTMFELHSNITAIAHQKSKTA